MPKSISVDPQNQRRRGELTFPTIPIHHYGTSLSEERSIRGDAALLNILRHMLIIREFEMMLGSFKAKGNYEGISYTYKGPAHLSIGQEGAAVGVGLALAPEDHIFGSHRSHGEFIAKGLSAITKLAEKDLLHIMETHQKGDLLRTVQRVLLSSSSVGLAENFLLFGIYCRNLHEGKWLQRRDGRVHACVLHALWCLPQQRHRGSFRWHRDRCGVAHETSRKQKHFRCTQRRWLDGLRPGVRSHELCWMAQFNTLRDESIRGGLPVLFCFNNNFYAMGGQTIGETMGWDRLSRIGAAVNPEAMHAETVDGTNPLAVADAVRRKRELLLIGKGPALLDVECYRSTGHSTTDANAYRTKEEISAWESHDPISSYASGLIEAGLLNDTSFEELKSSIRATVTAVTRAAVDPSAAPAVNIAADPTLIGKLMFSHETIELPSSKAKLLADPRNLRHACARMPKNRDAD